MQIKAQRHIVVADSKAKLYHVATWWMELGSDGTALNGDPLQPCYNIIETYESMEQAGKRARALNIPCS